MKEITTTVWFDRWLKDAEERRARRRQLEEIAEMMDISLSSVKRYLESAKKKLQNHMK